MKRRTTLEALLGTAAGPYNEYLDAKAALESRRSQRLPEFEVYVIYRRYADAATALGAALLLAAEENMIADDVYDTIEAALHAFVNAGDAAGHDPDNVTAQDEMIGAAFEVAEQLHNHVRGNRWWW